MLTLVCTVKMADQFDVSPADRKKLEARARRRAALREEFFKLSTDPRRHASGEGGAVVSKTNS